MIQIKVRVSRRATSCENAEERRFWVTLHASGPSAAAVPVGNLILPATEAESRITAGEDKTYDTADHVANLRAINVTPHVTQNRAVIKTGKNRNSAIAGKDMRCA